MVKWYILVCCVFGAGLGILPSCGQVKFSGGSSSTEAPPVNPSGQPRDVVFSTKVTPPNNTLDILLIIDDSNSMLPENQKLAQKMATFVNELGASSIDWQMCVAVTRALTVEGALTWGGSIFWSDYTPAAGGDGWILRPTSNLSTVFSKTIDNIGAGWTGTDDERGIKTAWWHFSRSGINKCYRPDSAIAVILISDEDVRSVGGVKALEYYADEAKPLENDDKPETLVAQVKSVFGENKRFTFNSIIVKPDDSACLAEQDSGPKSHYGKNYSDLSTLTGGGIGSICAPDYSTNLNLFKDIIQDAMGSFPLECIPLGAVAVTIEPAFTTTQSLDGPKINFEPKIPAGRQLTLKYKCAK